MKLEREDVLGSSLILGKDSEVNGKLTTDSNVLNNSYYHEEKKRGFSGKIGNGSISAGYGKISNTYEENGKLNAKSTLVLGDNTKLNSGANITATNF